MSQEERSIKGLFIRAAIYFAVAVLLGELVRWEIQGGEYWDSFSENGMLQWLQSAFLLACCILTIMKARSQAGFRELSICMALFFLVLLIRENDQPLEWFLWHGVWKYIAIFPIAALAIYFWKHRERVLDQALIYSRSLSFGVMLSGFTVLMFSRLFGRKSFWQEVMGEDFMRMVKNAAEEGVEVIALALILVAVVEFYIDGRNSRKT